MWGKWGTVAVLGCLGLACGSSSGDAETGDEQDLTSLSARQRKLSFEGLVYVAPDATDDAILEAARGQARSAFGALLASEIAVQSRELQNVDPASFRKKKVLVRDTSKATDAGTPMLEVRYLYRDNAIVPVAMSRKTSISLALFGPGADAAQKTIVEACTKNDAEARSDAAGGLLWYDFNPTKSSCRKLIEKEQRAIDAASAKLEDPRGMITLLSVQRSVIPVNMRLERADTATKATYPEYDKLFGRESLTIALVNGRLSHDRVAAIDDGGYSEWMAALDVVLAANPDMDVVKVEPAEDISKTTVLGKPVSGITFRNVIDWTLRDTSWPKGLTRAEKDQLAKSMASRLDNHWVTFEKKVKVAIGDAPAKDFTIRIETLFGAEEDAAPHQRAVKRGDVVIYNGHSYIGYGPLDPDNFQASSFPSTYQMFFFDSCVSYNYYEKDFFTLKPGGSKMLDIITNGIEAPEYLSGKAEGDFITRLVDGSMPSYQTLLEAAKETDSLRVVDGEIDNKWSPAKKITVSK